MTHWQGNPWSSWSRLEPALSEVARVTELDLKARSVCMEEVDHWQNPLHSSLCSQACSSIQVDVHLPLDGICPLVVCGWARLPAQMSCQHWQITVTCQPFDCKAKDHPSHSTATANGSFQWKSAASCWSHVSSGSHHCCAKGMPHTLQASLGLVQLALY